MAPLAVLVVRLRPRWRPALLPKGRGVLRPFLAQAAEIRKRGGGPAEVCGGGGRPRPWGWRGGWVW